MKKIQNIITVSAFALALIGAFAFNTKDKKTSDNNNSMGAS
jgi:hypothetical protein